MSSNLIANRYAKALMKLTDGDGVLAEKALNFLDTCNQIFSIPEARKVLRSPVMPADIKKTLLNFAAEKSNTKKEFGAFADQLVDAGRTSHLPEIFKVYKKILDEKRGVADASAITAELMSEDTRKELVAALEKVFKKKISLETSVDKEILGGVIVNVGNYTIDLSLRNRLNSVADFAQR
jgi:F-type H+-transporting ATPase subunit delta